MEKIAVVGTGGTGYTVAADLSLRGYEVHLCDPFRDESEEVKTVYDKTLRMTGAIKADTKVHMVTNDVHLALADVRRVICCTISNLDEQVARAIAPQLQPGTNVLLSAGNLGSFLYYKIFQECGVQDVVVGETSGNLFSCRSAGEGAVFFGNTYKPKKAAAFPVSGTQRLLDAFQGVYELLPGSCILETAFNGPNLLSHISLTLVNAGAIENSKEPYFIFKQGICRSTLNLADALWAEKKKVMDALGFPCTPSPSIAHRKYADPNIHEFDDFKNLEGPNSLSSRYITEDIPILGCLFLSVAKAVGVETPVYAAMVKVAETVNQTPYYKQGRTLENLGLDHLHGIQIPQFFQSAENL